MTHFSSHPCFAGKEIFTDAVRTFLTSVEPIIWADGTDALRLIDTESVMEHRKDSTQAVFLSEPPSTSEAILSRRYLAIRDRKI